MQGLNDLDPNAQGRDLHRRVATCAAKHLLDKELCINSRSMSGVLDPEPNGKVLFDTVRCSWLTGACGGASGPQIVEYDPAAGTMTAISEPPDSSGQAVNFINLPNGQVLAAAGNRDWIYTPVGSPLNSSRPTVTSVTANSNGSYHLTGTQLSGFVTTGEDDFQD